MSESHSPRLSLKLIAGLERVINEALRLDAASSAAFAKLAGQWVKISVTPFTGAIYMETGFPVKLNLTTNKTPDIEISGSPVALISFLLHADVTPRLKITGNPETAQHLAKITSQLDIDWEAKLGELIGDLPAHLLGKGVRETLHWLTYAGQQFAQDAEEYIHHETGALPSREEVNWWLREVDTLEDGTRQLDHRISQLERQVQYLRSNQADNLPKREG